MHSWKDYLRHSIRSPAELKLSQISGIDVSALQGVTDVYPMMVNPYYLSLIKEEFDPIWKQAIPDIAEIQDNVCLEDPLEEENLSPVDNLVHKYPDRVLFLVTNRCPLYCRFCTRKRRVGNEYMNITPDSIDAGIDYIRGNKAVREVLLSGGDPLMLEDREIDSLLGRLREIKHVEIIRIGTRMPCTLPMRITSELVAILQKYHPLFINTHFNHPRELTPEAKIACTLLADAGIPLGCQTVLLQGVNDNKETLKALFTGLLKLRVKPYYLFQTDLTKGTNHFRTKTDKGVSLLRDLIGHISGMAVPTFALDAPGGKGKIRLTPEYILQRGAELTFHNYNNELCSYPEVIEFLP